MDSVRIMSFVEMLRRSGVNVTFVDIAEWPTVKD
ncbi:phosphopantetheine-binding protein [Bacillus wiedmannii]